METKTPEVKTSHFFIVTGGIYPGKNRSTSIEVLSPDLEKGYESVKHWCKTNFPDWNHISDNPRLTVSLYQIPGVFSISHYHRNT